MIRATSIRAYQEIKERGLLSERRFQVYEVLVLNGPMTTGEIFKNFFDVKTKIPQNSINPRLSELERHGVVRAIGEKKCSVTGYTCTLWDVTDSLPLKLDKPNKRKCQACKGTGYIETQQARMF